MEGNIFGGLTQDDVRLGEVATLADPAFAIPPFAVTIGTAVSGIKSSTTPKCLVIGVGNAGEKTIKHMIYTQLTGVEIGLVANLYRTPLSISCKNVIRLEVIPNFGGSRPSQNRFAAEECILQMRAMLEGFHVLVLVAGLGGTTGSHATPVIAKLARQMGVRCIGVMSLPYHFEGPGRERTAASVVAELTNIVDTMIVIPSQSLMRIHDQITFDMAFIRLNEALSTAVRGIVDTIL